jgi:hypothetical protein
MNVVVQGQIPDLFINSDSGNDHNIGSKEQPLKTLYEAAERVNHANGKGAITIYLSEGIYGLDATIAFHPGNWHFSKDERLTICATVLPDDSVWNPGMMPVIVSAMPLDFKPYGNQDRLEGLHMESRLKQVTLQFRVFGF